MQVSFFDRNNMIVTGKVSEHKNNFIIMGGKWNHSLKGWIFPTSEINKFVSYINDTKHINTQNEESCSEIDSDYEISKSEEIVGKTKLLSNREEVVNEPFLLSNSEEIVNETKLSTNTKKCVDKDKNCIFKYENVKAEKYSEKSFVLRGNTKIYKENIKKLGGKWNPSLKDGPGWIFSMKKVKDVSEFFENI